MKGGGGGGAFRTFLRGGGHGEEVMGWKGKGKKRVGERGVWPFVFLQGERRRKRVS